MRLTYLLFATLVASTLAPAASAQTTEPRNAVTVFGGLQTAAPATGGALGFGLTRDLGDRLAVEGGLVFADRGAGADALTASGGVRVTLGDASAAVAPYLALGAGVYRASFDLDDRQLLGPIGTGFAGGEPVCAALGPSGPGPRGGFGPGDGFGAGATTCPQTVALGWGVGDMPRFYARRLGALAVPGGLAWGTRSFTDPVLTIGGGVRMNVGERLTIRPDARALVVLDGRRTRTVGQFGLDVGLRF